MTCGENCNSFKWVSELRPKVYLIDKFLPLKWSKYWSYQMHLVKWKFIFDTTWNVLIHKLSPMSADHKLSKKECVVLKQYKSLFWYTCSLLLFPENNVELTILKLKHNAVDISYVRSYEDPFNAHVDTFHRSWNFCSSYVIVPNLETRCRPLCNVCVSKAKVLNSKNKSSSENILRNSFKDAWFKRYHS